MYTLMFWCLRCEVLHSGRLLLTVTHVVGLQWINTPAYFAGASIIREKFQNIHIIHSNEIIIYDFEK
jgi:hypothetical protein